MHDTPEDQRLAQEDKRLAQHPALEDATYQRAVLGHVLTLHPLPLTCSDLIREIADDPSDYGTRDNIQRAVRDLIRLQLLQTNGDYLLPTHASVRLNELWGGSA
jgi:hypothetical protein